MPTCTRRTFPCGTAIAFVLIAFSTPQARAQKSSKGFLGQTQATAVGGLSLNSLHGRCTAEFGDKARLCTSDEIFDSGQTDGPIDEGWVQPTIQYTYDMNGIIICGVDRTSGIQSCQSPVGPAPFSAGSLNCQSWNSSDPSLRGLTYQPANGQFTISSCGTPRPVNCCRK